MAIQTTPFEVSWRMPLVLAGHYVAQASRIHAGTKIERPRKWAEALDLLKNATTGT